MQGRPKAPSRADCEALADQNGPGVNINWSPSTVSISPAAFGVSTQGSIVFPESSRVERLARRTEEA
jgi:hypothetical protein